MLGHSLISALRTSPLQNKAVDLMCRRMIYDNLRVRRLKYKSAAKERRKALKRSTLGGLQTPKDIGEKVPPFFIPVRYKLLFKCL